MSALGRKCYWGVYQNYYGSVPLVTTHPLGWQVDAAKTLSEVEHAQLGGSHLLEFRVARFRDVTDGSMNCGWLRGKGSLSSSATGILECELNSVVTFDGNLHMASYYCLEMVVQILHVPPLATQTAQVSRDYQVR